MEIIVERPAALDVHKAQVTACVRIPDEHGQRQEQHRRVRHDRPRSARFA